MQQRHISTRVSPIWTPVLEHLWRRWGGEKIEVVVDLDTLSSIALFFASIHWAIYATKNDTISPPNEKPLDTPMVEARKYRHCTLWETAFWHNRTSKIQIAL